MSDLGEKPEPTTDEAPPRAAGGIDAGPTAQDLSTPREADPLPADQPLSAQTEADSVPDEVTERESTDDDDDPRTPDSGDPKAQPESPD